MSHVASGIKSQTPHNRRSGDFAIYTSVLRNASPQRFGMQKNESKSLVDYQSLVSILTPVHHLHHSLRRIEASSNEKYNGNPTTEEKFERQTLSKTDTVLTTKLSSAFPFQLSLLKAEQISELARASAEIGTNMTGNEMFVCASSPCNDAK
jgi:hypothetical protein